MSIVIPSVAGVLPIVSSMYSVDRVISYLCAVSSIFEKYSDSSSRIFVSRISFKILKNAQSFLNVSAISEE